MAFLKLTSMYSCTPLLLNADEIVSIRKVQVCDNVYTEIQIKNGKCYNVSESLEEVAKIIEGWLRCQIEECLQKRSLTATTF